MVLHNEGVPTSIATFLKKMSLSNIMMYLKIKLNQ